MTQTKEKILDIAERLFGEHGYGATSLRQVIAEAGVNLAAVHYHYGTKEDLLDAVVLRGAIPLNEERLALLDRYEKDAAPGPVAVDKVLHAILAPTFLKVKRSPEFAKLMGRLLAEGIMPGMVARHFKPTVERFIPAMRRSLPDLPEQELFWRVQFMFGAMAQTLLGRHLFPEALAGPADSLEVVDRLVSFLAAGFRAPVPEFATRQEK
jgi:AcrR family transcriptional regulator